MVEVLASARLYPTEDVERVRRCLLNVFPEAVLEEMEGTIRARTDDLSRFKEIIRNHRILDSTRAVMLRGMTDEGMAFQMNKQAAFVGKMDFDPGLDGLIAPEAVAGDGQAAAGILTEVPDGLAVVRKRATDDIGIDDPAGDTEAIDDG